jgi:tetratricopeptide (TPR) repeat protein
MLPRAVEHAVQHLSTLYEAAVRALESHQKADSVGAARALLIAGQVEERAGHYRQAQAWYDHALRIAEELVDQHPEIEALRHIGGLRRIQGYYDDGACFLERSLALADSIQDSRDAALACHGLGEIALERHQSQSASAWFTRGLAYAGTDALMAASLRLGLSEVLLNRNELNAADDRVRQAFALCEFIGNAQLAALCLDTSARIESARQRFELALSRHRDAMARLARESADPRLELRVRLNVCQLFLDWNRLPDAEDEVRRAEEVAIVHALRRQLAWLYVLMGRVRARQHDDAGSVFFEKAIELCRGTQPLTHLEAKVYGAYSRYHLQFGAVDEAQACIEHARELAGVQGACLECEGTCPAWWETGGLALS